jgi:hypothetical protein
MLVETGAQAAQFPEKEYINGSAFAVYSNGKPVAVIGEFLSIKVKGVNRKMPKFFWLSSYLGTSARPPLFLQPERESFT